MAVEGTGSQRCPRCGADDSEISTKIDLAFGEEVPFRACRNCGNEYDHGLPSTAQKRDDS